MARYAIPGQCPECAAPLAATALACAQCHLPLNVPAAAALWHHLIQADIQLGELQQLRAVAQTPRASPPPSTPPLPTWVPDQHRPSEASVPKILLGLGASLLIIAAIIFMAFAWPRLGIGGKTTILLGLTLAAGGLAQQCATRKLPIATEAVLCLFFGLFVLDIVGANSSGWWGSLSPATLGLVCALAVAALGFLLTVYRGEHQWRTPQVCSAGALWLAPIGAVELTDRQAVVFGSACLLIFGLAWAARRLQHKSLARLYLAAASFWWLVQVADALNSALAHSMPREFFGQGYGWLLVGAATTSLAPTLYWRQSRPWPSVFLGVSATLLSLLVVLPAGTLSNTAQVLLQSVVAVAWAVTICLIPRGWQWGARIPLYLLAMWPLALWIKQLSQSLPSLVTIPLWSRDFSDQLPARADSAQPLLLPFLAAVLIGIGLALLRDRIRILDFSVPLAAIVALHFLVTFALRPMPVALITLALMSAGTSILWWTLRHREAAKPARSMAIVICAGYGCLAAITASASVSLTALTMTWFTAVFTSLGWRGPSSAARTLGQLLGPSSFALAMWSVGEIIELPLGWRACFCLALLGMALLRRPLVVLELSILLWAVIGLNAVLSSAQWTAAYLTIAATILGLSALIHPARRQLGWASGAVLTMALWIQLATSEITTPEAYSLPSACALLILGGFRLRQGSGSWGALGPGLSLALGPPSLLVLTTGALSVRGLVLGLAGSGLILAGAHWRLTAPLTVGAAVSALAAIRAIGPYTSQLPPWAIIAAIGIGLSFFGITWETRVQQARATQRFLNRLR